MKPDKAQTSEKTLKHRSRRRKQRRTKALVTALTLAAGTQAYGEAVRFENTGDQFNWLLNTLDITLPVDQQPGTIGDPSTIYQNYFSDNYPAFSYQHTYSTGNGAEIFGSGFNNNYAQPNDAGTQIGPGLMGGAWQQNLTFEFAFTQCDYYGMNCSDGNRGMLPEGLDTYLGVRFDVGNGAQYGWIGVNRQGALTDVFAWGYETEPGVAIPAGVPEPGTLAMLAAGFVAAGATRRRGRNDSEA